jgi:hypothetical protein
MGAGAFVLLFVLLVFVVVAVGVLSAVRAGLWASESGPAPGERGDGDGERPRRVVDEDDGEARFDAGSRERDAARR